MLFGTGPSSGNAAGPNPHYSPYTHGAMVVGQQSAQFKSLHPALMNNMLHASSATGPSQSELVPSLNYHHQLGLHHRSHIESPVTQVARAPSCGDSKSGTGSSESPNSSHRAQNASPSSSSGGGHSHGNQNEVRTVMLYNVPIVSLMMDGQERLCLAQISNTLLKNFNYNEIHNR